MAKQTNKRRDLRILFHSNAIYTGSGYAVEMRDVLTRLKKDGWEVGLVANHGVQSHPVDIMGIKHYPLMGEANNSDGMLHHALDYKADVVISMLDAWVIQKPFLIEMNKRGIKWVPWIPIDQEPVNPGVIENIKEAYRIMTFSEYGRSMLEKQGFASTMIIEGVDTEIFKPSDKIEAKKALKIPEPDKSFLFGMIGANKENPPRKGYQEALEAFKVFSDKHPEALMFFHCQQVAAGFPIVAYAQHLGIGNKIIYLDQYRASYGSNSERIAQEINAFDVLMHPSMTEGFGLLSVEAQACGVPVLVNRCTSMPELVIENKTGWICEHERPWWRNGGGYVYPANPQSLYEKMEEVYKALKEDKDGKIAKACRKNVLTKYNIDSIVKDKWIPFLNELQEEILPEQNR